MGLRKLHTKRATGHRGRELLLLQGMTVDYISELGDMMNEPTLQDPVLLQWRGLAALTTLPPTAFWTALTLELDESSKRMSADRLQAFHNLLKECNCFAEPQTFHSAREFARLCYRAMGRRFFITRHGRIGLAHWNVKVNDEVYVLFGGQTPFILRPASHGEHTLCADAYVYGIMDGEAMADYEAGKYAKQEYRIR